MNTSRQGHSRERQCVRELTERGYVAIRSAGSKKMWDVVAIGPNDIKLIQCKKTNKNIQSAIAPKAVVEEMRYAPAPNSGVVTKELWTWVNRKGWFITVVS